MKKWWWLSPPLLKVMVTCHHRHIQSCAYASLFSRNHRQTSSTHSESVLKGSVTDRAMSDRHAQRSVVDTLMVAESVCCHNAAHRRNVVYMANSNGPSTLLCGTPDVHAGWWWTFGTYSDMLCPTRIEGTEPPKCTNADSKLGAEHFQQKCCSFVTSLILTLMTWVYRSTGCSGKLNTVFPKTSIIDTNQTFKLRIESDLFSRNSIERAKLFLWKYLKMCMSAPCFRLYYRRVFGQTHQVQVERWFSQVGRHGPQRTTATVQRRRNQD